MNAPALPAFLQNRQSKALATDLSANLGIGSPPYISIKGNRFTLIDATGAEELIETYDPKIGSYLDCVIIDNCEHISKVFYDKPFDPNANQYEAPACFSDNGVGPSRSASRPQARTCAECPNAIWGSKVSAISGKGVKACSDQQKLAILIPGDSVIFLLRVPPNSLSQLRGYNQKFIGQQVDVSDVITRMWLEPGSIGLLNFQALNYIDEAAFNHRETVLKAHQTDALVGRTDMPRTEALPAPNQPALAAPAPAQPAQQPQPFTAPAAAPMTVAPSAVPAASPAPTAAPTPERPQRRRRNTAAATAPAAPVAQPTVGVQGTSPQAPFRPQPTAPAAQPNFGMQAPAPAGGEITAALDSLFGPQA